MAIHDSLGNRMKEYESRNQYYLQKRTPVCIRVDIRAGHTFTRGFVRPFDEVFGNAMMRTMEYCAKNIGNCVFAYCQSDEITLILVDYKHLNTSAWFDYEVQKMCSIAASMATMAFNKFFFEEIKEFDEKHKLSCIAIFNNSENEITKLHDTYWKAYHKGAMFDARCFNIPKEEVTNLIYWRQLDATRNSIQMVGQANFSYKELQNKTCNMIQDMLHEERGINWNDFPTHQKRGTCVVRKPNDEGCSEWVIDTEIPIFKGEGRAYIEDLIQPEEE